MLSLGCQVITCQIPGDKPYHTSLFLEGSPKSIFLNDEEIIVTGGIIDLEILPGSYIRSIHTKQKK